MIRPKKFLSNVYLVIKYFLLLTMSIAFGSTISYAMEFYVAKTGNDANPGTAASSFLTIKKGMMSMGSGDTLFIRAGTYTDRLDSNVFTMPVGTSWTNAPVIKAFPGEEVIIKPTGGASVINLAHSYIQYMIFEGLILDAVNGTPDIGSAISLGRGANHIRFLNIEAKNATLNVVLINQGTEGTNYNEFIGGSYHHSDLHHSSNLHKGAYIFYVMSNHNLFDGLDVHDATGYGFHIWNSADPKPSYNVIKNCRIHGNNIRNNTHAGILLGNGDGNKAYNNLIYENRGDGIQTQGGRNAMIINNTIFKNGQDGIEVGMPWNTTMNTMIKNNISYSNGMTNYKINESQAPGTTLSNNILDGTNPVFIDSTNRDFHLKEGSPAIDSGLTLPEPIIDFEGNTRPQGSNFDIGAMEFIKSGVGAPRNVRLLTIK